MSVNQKSILSVALKEAAEKFEPQIDAASDLPKIDDDIKSQKIFALTNEIGEAHGKLKKKFASRPFVKGLGVAVFAVFAPFIVLNEEENVQDKLIGVSGTIAGLAVAFRSMRKSAKATQEIEQAQSQLLAKCGRALENVPRYIMKGAFKEEEAFSPVYPVSGEGSRVSRPSDPPPTP